MVHTHEKASISMNNIQKIVSKLTDGIANTKNTPGMQTVKLTSLYFYHTKNGKNTTFHILQTILEGPLNF
jgi:hypothetical protein